ncbi:MAG: InlB B-repeat-containing protein [Paludibacteraceae bacterium]|nr:InlB B-repeat-containing protein [Paludibacteraceae bacterium]
MKKKIFFLAAMFCVIATGMWARSWTPVDSIPAEVFLKDLRYDKQTKELQFKDLFHADKYLTRIYAIYVFARDEETTFYLDHGFFPHDTYMYGYCKDGAHYSSEINFTNIGMGYCTYYTATDMTGGAKYTDGLFNGSKKFPTFKAILDSCLKRGYPSIRVAICPQYERKAAIEDYNIRVSYYNPEGGLGAYDTQKWLINYVDIDLDVDPTNEVIVPEEVKFGEFYDVKRVIAAAGKTDYKFQESSDNLKWHTIESGQLNTAQARHGDTLSVELALDAYRVGKTAAYYRSIATDVKTGKADTSAVKKVTYLYKARFEGEGEVAETYIPAGFEIEVPDPSEEPCIDFAYTSDLPVQISKAKGDWKVTMPACNLIIAQVTPKYTVKFLNADYTVLKTEEVVCGEAATAPATPSMEGMTFKQWSRDFSEVKKNMTVMAQYEMGDDYFFYDIMTAHTNDRYKAPDFAGSTKRAMIGDSLTFTAEIRTPQESTLRYQQGLRDAEGNWTWGDPKTIATYTAADAASGESKTFTLKVAAAYEYYNEMYSRYGEAYRFNLYCAGSTLLSEPYEFDIYYPLFIKSRIKESETIQGTPIYESLTLENAAGDLGWSDLSALFPARRDEKVHIYRDNGGAGVCMKFARILRPESYYKLETGEDKKGTYIIAPGEIDTVHITVAKKAVVFDGAQPTQAYDFTSEGCGNWPHAYYAEVVNCGGSILNVPADPVSNTMIFKGWEPWDKTAYDSLAYLNVPAVEDNYIGFTAQWEEIPVIKTFTVRFFEKDGTTQIGADQIVNEGENAVPPLAPEVDGFYFIGWDKPYTTITADVDIVAVYGENKFWTVTYYDEDGTTKLGEETVADGMSAQGNPVSKDGYNFLGWFDMSDNPADFSKISADMSVKAKWEKIILYFKVTLKAEHGKIAVVETGIDLTKVQENTVLHFTATPDDGYQFVEWKNYDPDKGLTVTEDITVTAVFEEIPPATYKVTLEAEHGTIEVVETGINLNKVVANTVLHFTATPDKGYLFKEWVNYDPDKGLKVTKNITVTAIFEEDSQGIDSVTGNPSSVTKKVIRDGQVLILRDGHVYNVLGIEIQ